MILRNMRTLTGPDCGPAFSTWICFDWDCDSEMMCSDGASRARYGPTREIENQKWSDHGGLGSDEVTCVVSGTLGEPRAFGIGTSHRGVVAADYGTWMTGYRR